MSKLDAHEAWMTSEMAEVQKALATMESTLLVPDWQREKGGTVGKNGGKAGYQLWEGGHGSPVVAKCHTSTIILTLPHLTLYLDAWQWVEPLTRKGEVDMGIKLTGPVYAASGTTLSGAVGLVKALSPFVTASVAAPVMGIDWPDMGVPPLKPAFWPALAKEVMGKKVGIGCGAGHGRTGTAAAALLVSIYAITTDEAVNFLRKGYCKEVVETPGQIALIREAEGAAAAHGERHPWPADWERITTPVTGTRVVTASGGSGVWPAGTYQWPHEKQGR